MTKVRRPSGPQPRGWVAFAEIPLPPAADVARVAWDEDTLYALGHGPRCPGNVRLELVLGHCPARSRVAETATIVGGIVEALAAAGAIDGPDRVVGVQLSWSSGVPAGTCRISARGTHSPKTLIARSARTAKSRRKPEVAHHV